MCTCNIYVQCFTACISTHSEIKDKSGIADVSAIVPWYPRLILTIFIADLFHTIAEASSIVFDLRPQFFGNLRRQFGILTLPD